MQQVTQVSVSAVVCQTCKGCRIAILLSSQLWPLPWTVLFLP